MYDTDRIRAAADMIEHNAWNPDNVDWKKWKADYVALLRAVAATHERQDGEPDDGPCGCPELEPALALAAAVLDTYRARP